MKPPCVQPSGMGSEDCLYLNIYTNAYPTNKGFKFIYVLTTFKQDHTQYCFIFTEVV